MFVGPVSLNPVCCTTPGFKLRSNVKSDRTTSTQVKEFLTDPFVSSVVDNLIFPRTLLIRPTYKRTAERMGTSPNIVDQESADPSIIFATLANTYGDLICIDINQDISQAVCGYRDSVVRVYNLKGNATEGSQLKNSFIHCTPEVFPPSKNSMRNKEVNKSQSGKKMVAISSPLFLTHTQFCQNALGMHRLIEGLSRGTVFCPPLAFNQHWS